MTISDAREATFRLGMVSPTQSSCVVMTWCRRDMVSLCRALATPFGVRHLPPPIYGVVNSSRLPLPGTPKLGTILDSSHMA